MTVAHAQRVSIRLFLEGIEIPVIAANVQCAPNSPAMATIQIPPLAEGTRLLPRTLVHLFYFDGNAFDAGNKLEVRPDPGQDATNPVNNSSVKVPTTSDFSPEDLRNRKYKVLFIGEVIGFQWTRTPRNSVVILQCADLSNYWDYAYQYNNTSIFGPDMKAVFSGGATNLFTDFMSSEGGILTGIVLSGACNTFPKMSGLAAGFIRLIEAIGGTYFPAPGSKNKAIAGQNTFFSISELRLHITQMIAAVEKDDTSSKLLAFQGYGGLFDRALGGLGEQTSIRSALTALSKVIFYETYPQPCPYYIPGSNNEPTGVHNITIKGHPIWGDIYEAAQQASDTRINITNSLLRLEAGTDVQSSLLAIRSMLSDYKTFCLKTAAGITARNSQQPPSNTKESFSAAAMHAGEALAVIMSFRPGENPEQASDLNSKILEPLAASMDEINRVFDATVEDNADKTIIAARLAQQILRPDIWFGAPPRCNVIFPEQYNVLEYTRMYLQEPTRLLLKTNDEFFGEDALFDSYYFAPQAGSAKADKHILQSVTTGSLLEHEVYTGILPVFEKMGEFNIFAASDRKNSNFAKVGPAQRSANFLYFKYRFAARKMQLRGKFNPYIAVGFPGLVIDKPASAQALTTYQNLASRASELGLTSFELSKVLGTNFLGSFNQVSHSVSQVDKMGTTEIVCTFGRQPEENASFLGAFKENFNAIRKDDAKALRSVDVAAATQPQLYSFGPNLGRIVAVTDVTSDYAGGINADNPGEPRRLPLFDVNSRANRGKRSIEVPVGVPVSGSILNSAEVSSLVGDPFTAVTFHAYRVTEEIPRYRKTAEEIPIEDLIRPGWYGSIWSTAEISDVYKQFFGIGSITEAQTISGPNGSAIGMPLSEDGTAVSAEEAAAKDAEDPYAFAASVLALEKGTSIRQAVDFLSLTYSYIKQKNLDVDTFIKTYTWRPVATMLDIFGTMDLELSASGHTVVKGVEGFHSRAFGPYSDLFGLTSPSINNILGLSPGSDGAADFDVRGEKYKAVQRYITVLTQGRAIRG